MSVLSFCLSVCLPVCIQLVHPFDLLKVRKQLLGSKGNVSMGKLAGDIYKTEGVKGLYAGLSAAAARQLT